MLLPIGLLVVASNPSNYLADAANLRPGDTLTLEAGTYTDCLELRGVNGTAAQPITITGPTSGAPAIFTATNCQNPGDRFVAAQITLFNSSYIVIKNLELDGEGLFVDGIEATYDCDSVHHITIEDVLFHDQSGDSGVNAISTKCNAWDWTIRRNVMRNVGLGMYLGDSPGDAPFIRGVIEHNLVENAMGYSMQIKHQIGRPNPAGIPTGDSVTLIRHNVFIRQRNGAGGNAARPNLLLGHFPDNGAGATDRYEVYGNVFFDNDVGEALIQAEGNLAIHDNVMVNNFGGPAIFVAPHNGVPKEVAIYRNTIIASGAGIHVSGGDASFTQRVVGNAIFAGTPLEAANASDNITDTMANAGNYVVNGTAVLGQSNPYPLVGQLGGTAIDLAAYGAHTDFGVDFNGSTRVGTFRGAYAGAGTNPGWIPAATIKPRPGPTTPPDAGTAMTGDAGSAMGDMGTAPAADATTTPMVDAGALIDAGAATPSDSGARASSQANDPTRRAQGGGCGCAAQPTQVSARSVGLLLMLALLIVRKRHR